jgi:hypothetical protein
MDKIGERWQGDGRKGADKAVSGYIEAYSASGEIV